MAKNYTIAEAVQIIAENGDNEALMDLGKRYPLLTQKIARVAVKAGEDFIDLMSFMPEYLSANKVNSAIKKMLDEAPDADEDVEDGGDEEEAEEKPFQLELSSFLQAHEDLDISFISRALDQAGGNQRSASELLGLTYDQFRGLYRKYKGRLR